MAYVQGVLERMKIAVLIPSFNEEKTVGWLVREVCQAGYDVLVIDDGSKDNTAKFARDSGAEVVINEHNLGKGATLRKGFDNLVKRDYDAVIMMDADGQHLPKDIPQFVKCYEEHRPGVIVGNRMSRAKGMPLVRWWTNKFMSYLISKKCKQPVPDSQCGFRLIDTKVLKKIKLTTQNFEIESEILVEASRNGFRIENVPITTVYDGQTSAIHPFKDTLRFFKFINSRQ
jgi:glycosyltransferase involved in cell wall biosynthesis